MSPPLGGFTSLPPSIPVGVPPYGFASLPLCVPPCGFVSRPPLRRLCVPPPCAASLPSGAPPTALCLARFVSLPLPLVRLPFPPEYSFTSY